MNILLYHSVNMFLIVSFSLQYHDSLSVPEEEAILDTRVVSAEDNGHISGALNVSVMMHN